MINSDHFTIKSNKCGRAKHWQTRWMTGRRVMLLVSVWASMLEIPRIVSSDSLMVWSDDCSATARVSRNRCRANCCSRSDMYLSCSSNSEIGSAHRNVSVGCRIVCIPFCRLPARQLRYDFFKLKKNFQYFIDTLHIR